MSATATEGRPAGLDLAAYLAHQRWFAGKGRTWQVTGTMSVGTLREAGAGLPGVRVDVVQVTYDDGETETYQLPLASYPEPATHLVHALVGEEVDDAGSTWFVYDALHDKDSTGLWVEGIETGRTGPGFAFH
ncbi:MAG: maltokinase N-terminal cap-like domain-containing protein, partial [Actinomycetes bacterium]